MGFHLLLDQQLLALEVEQLLRQHSRQVVGGRGIGFLHGEQLLRQHDFQVVLGRAVTDFFGRHFHLGQGEVGLLVQGFQLYRSSLDLGRLQLYPCR
ncbi:hypothetical protein D3C87_1697920 [compost metagenome]